MNILRGDGQVRFRRSHRPQLKKAAFGRVKVTDLTTYRGARLLYTSLNRDLSRLIRLVPRLNQTPSILHSLSVPQSN